MMGDVTFRESNSLREIHSCNYFESHPYLSETRAYRSDRSDSKDLMISETFRRRENRRNRSSRNGWGFTGHPVHTLSEGLPRTRGKDLLSRGRDDGFDLARRSRTKRPKRPTNEGKRRRGAYMWGAAHGQTVNEPSSPRLPSPHPFHDRSSRRPRCCSAEVGRLRRAIRRRSCPSGRVYRVSREFASREEEFEKMNTSNNAYNYCLCKQ